MTRQVVFRPHYELLQWAADRLDLTAWPPESFPIGIADDETGAVSAVFVVNAFYDGQCSLHVASDHTRTWATPRVLGDLFGRIFAEDRIRRVNVQIRASDVKTMVTAVKLGFVPEGRMRAGMEDGEDAILWSMLAQDCKWIDRSAAPAEAQEVEHGQEVVSAEG